MIRCFISCLLVFVALSSPAWSQDRPSLDELLDRSGSDRDNQSPEIASDIPVIKPELSSEPGQIAVLRGLDKVTARTRDFDARVGEQIEFGALAITVRYCRKRPPEEPPEVFAFIEVLDRRTDGSGVEAEGERIFSGWMFASSPALNSLEHPVYDFWVIDCKI